MEQEANVKEFQLHYKVGTDICSVQRIEKTHERFGDKFLLRILTDAERHYVLSQPKRLGQRVAARFAAKEAVSKALGVGWNGLSWRDIEVVRRSSGEPALALHGHAAKLAQSLGLSHFEVSISHEREFATALVFAYGE